MNKLITKATIFATLVTTATLMTAPAKADQLVSLETAVDMFVAQQSQVVFNDVTRLVANNIQQEIANFNINSVFDFDSATPSVTITEIAQNIESTEKSVEYSPK